MQYSFDLLFAGDCCTDLLVQIGHCVDHLSKQNSNISVHTHDNDSIVWIFITQQVGVQKYNLLKFGRWWLSFSGLLGQKKHFNMYMQHVYRSKCRKICAKRHCSKLIIICITKLNVSINQLKTLCLLYNIKLLQMKTQQ